MTLSDVLTRTLYRVGLDESVAPYRTKAREYVNDTLRDLESRCRWWWLYTGSTLTTAAGTSTYDLSSDLAEVGSFRDETHNRPLYLHGAEDLDARDPDGSETGDPIWVILVGVSSTTGLLQARLYPTPADVATIAYRYYRHVPELTSDDDDTDLQTGFGIPPVVQPVLYQGAAHYYLQEIGDDDSGVFNQVGLETALKAALTVNGRMQGNRRYRVRRRDAGSNRTLFQPREGSLS